MPLYEYACDDCGQLTEVLQKVSDPGPSQCSHCGAKDPNRVMSKGAFILKGTGWYATDYKDPPDKKPATAEASKEKTPAADQNPNPKTQTKEAKPAKAAENKA